jgi:diaminopimelate epimerase
MALQFTKMHGLGNDFLVLDLVTQNFELTPELVQQWSNRNTGVGFDQLLTLEPPTQADADFWWGIYNADGSSAEQCGNGARCIAKFIAEKQLSPKPSIRLQTPNGIIETQLDTADSATVNMGQPQPDAEQITISTSAGDVQVLRVSMGNPHAVIFVDNIHDAPVATLGAELTAHSEFPEGANIGFCQVIDQGFVRLRVYERGVGETQACGSGACAAATAGQMLGHLGPRVKVSLPGGKLKIAWPGPGQDLRMTGPATTVYSGTIDG